MIPIPDYYFNGDAIDEDIPGNPIPMAQLDTDANSRYAKLPGCYAWVDPDTDEVWYVGKAINLRARLSEHWRHSPFIDDMIAQDICPAVYVWLSGERAGLERQLIDSLQPLRNKRIE